MDWVHTHTHTTTTTTTTTTTLAYTRTTSFPEEWSLPCHPAGTYHPLRPRAPPVIHTPTAQSSSPSDGHPRRGASPPSLPPLLPAPWTLTPPHPDSDSALPSWPRLHPPHASSQVTASRKLTVRWVGPLVRSFLQSLENNAQGGHSGGGPGEDRALLVSCERLVAQLNIALCHLKTKMKFCSGQVFALQRVPSSDAPDFWHNACKPERVVLPFARRLGLSKLLSFPRPAPTPPHLPLCSALFLPISPSAPPRPSPSPPLLCPVPPHLPLCSALFLPISPSAPPCSSPSPPRLRPVPPHLPPPPHPPLPLSGAGARAVLRSLFRRGNRDFPSAPARTARPNSFRGLPLRLEGNRRDDGRREKWLSDLCHTGCAKHCVPAKQVKGHAVLTMPDASCVAPHGTAPI